MTDPEQREYDFGKFCFHFLLFCFFVCGLSIGGSLGIFIGMLWK